MSEVASEGRRLIDRWTAADKELRSAQSRLNSAECEAANAKQAMAKWLLPEDAKPGEKLAIWYGDGSLIQVEVAELGRDHIITVRQRGKHAIELGRVA